MKLLLDMNLPPSWCAVLQSRGHEAVHWSTQGDPRATDLQIMEFAATRKYVVVTYDLDFGALLASTHATQPSVVLIRAANVAAPTVEALLIAALNASADELTRGAIVTVEEAGRRVRSLPFR